jgi:hypothetical protein
MLQVVYCMLYVACCLLHVVCCMLYVVCCTLHPQVFLSFETPDRQHVYGFLKLRFNDDPYKDTCLPSSPALA